MYLWPGDGRDGHHQAFSDTHSDQGSKEKRQLNPGRSPGTPEPARSVSVRGVFPAILMLCSTRIAPISGLSYSSL